MDNREGIKVIMHFDDDSEGVKVRAYDVAKFPEAKKPEMYELCNQLNKDYRWIKFYVDDSDNTITAEEDAIIQLDTCAQEVLQCCIQLVNIVDDAYPTIMKRIFC